MYRIISGQWKAKRISAPKNFDVRPTTDFAKEALFSILENRFRLDFASLSVLDLFAGIGSLSLEFASRGCKDVTSVEMNAKHAGFISTTAAELEMALHVNVQRANVFEFLKKNRAGKAYDLIVADPPFNTDKERYSELTELVFGSGFLKENGLFVLEHQSRVKPEHLGLLDTRKYGNISFSFFQAPEQTTEPESVADPV